MEIFEVIGGRKLLTFTQLDDCGTLCLSLVLITHRFSAGESW